MRSEYRRNIKLAKQRATDKFIKNALNQFRVSRQVISSTKRTRSAGSSQVSTEITPMSSIKKKSGVSQELFNRLPSAPHRYDNYLNRVSLKTVRSTEVTDALRSLRDKKNRNVYNISIALIKSVQCLIISPLTRLLNCVLKMGPRPRLCEIFKTSVGY